MGEKIKIGINNWLFNAGVVGFVNILENSNEEYKLEKNYLEFSSSSLIDFEEKYFNFLFVKYGSFTVYSEIMSYKDSIERYLKNIENIDEKTIEHLNKIIEYVKDKIKRNSYKAAYPYIKLELDIIREEKTLKKIRIKKKQEISEVLQEVKFQLKTLDSIIDYLGTGEAKKYLMAKDFIYSFTNSFLTGVAVWGKTEASKDPYEVYKEYFVDSTLSYIEADKEKYKHSCTSCNKEVRGMNIKNESYNLTWINNTGVDGSRKSSHYWNYNNDTVICPICNLIYSCIPCGFTSINGKGFFINNNNNLESLFKINKFQIDKDTKIEDLENLSYYNVIDNINQASISTMEYEVQNIQVVKYDSANLLRPYSFNFLSKEMIYIIHKNKETLKKLMKFRIKVTKDYWINLYQEVLKRLYNNQNQYDLIVQLFKMNENSRYTGYIYLVLKINNDFIGGKMKMDERSSFEKKINHSRYFGQQLREEYLKKDNLKKIEGMSYRFLNAIKTKNASRFIDILINAYMYVGIEIPYVFIDTLKDKELLQSYGYAFLLGLQGSKEKETNKKNKEEN